MSRPKAKRVEHWALQREIGENVPPNMRLHMSPKKVSKLLPMEKPTAPDDKPNPLMVGAAEDRGNGIWYDFDGEWICWTAGHHFAFARYFYTVEIDPQKVLVIDTEDKFDAFHEEFKMKPRIFQFMEDLAGRITEPANEQEKRFVEGMRLLTEKEDGFFNNAHQIDWPRVAERHGGVEISTAVPWMKRMERKWYYTWDCRSGVIWDVTAIKSFTLYARWDNQAKMYVKEDK